ncbi:MAG TPA: CopG family transcriptional regulator [Patescibacteria group bacterium]|nr:CopG family transcriptional regulator [Patescibacteria group bacterium]
MTDFRRIMVNVPNQLLREVDGIIAIDNLSRSQFVQEAMLLYLEERKRKVFLATMQRGYQEMAVINLSLAEESLQLEEESLGAMFTGFLLKTE